MVRVGLSQFSGSEFYAEGLYDHATCHDFIAKELQHTKEDRFHVPCVYELSEYAKSFSLLEIDHFFYNKEHDNFYNLSALMARYRSSVPETFRFSVRIPSVITKDRRLQEVRHELSAFFEGIHELQPLLESVILSFDRSFVRSEQFDVFSEFIRHLPSAYRYVVSFDDASWYVPLVFNLLHKHGIILCKTVTLATAAHHARYLKDYRYLRLLLSEKEADHVDSFIDAVRPYLRDDATIILSMPVKASLLAKKKLYL